MFAAIETAARRSWLCNPKRSDVGTAAVARYINTREVVGDFEHIKFAMVSGHDLNACIDPAVGLPHVLRRKPFPKPARTLLGSQFLRSMNFEKHAVSFGSALRPQVPRTPSPWARREGCLTVRRDESDTEGSFDAAISPTWWAASFLAVLLARCYLSREQSPRLFAGFLLFGRPAAGQRNAVEYE